MNEHYYSNLLNFILILKGLRIIRFLRILFVFTPLRLSVVSLINTVPYMARTFICLIIIFLFYTIWGMHLFSGAEEYRCRTTPEPEMVNGTLSWPVSHEVEFRCGYWTCPEGFFPICNNKISLIALTVGAPMTTTCHLITTNLTVKCLIGA